VLGTDADWRKTNAWRRWRNNDQEDQVENDTDELQRRWTVNSRINQ